MVRTQCCHCQNPGFNPWWGNQDPTCLGQKKSASLRGRGALEHLGRGRLGRTSPSNSAVCGLSVWFSRSVVSDSLRPHEPQHGQVSLSITNSRSPPKPVSIELVTPSKHLILCSPLLLLPSFFPSIRVFSNESVCTVVYVNYISIKLENFKIKVVAHLYI